MNLRERELPWVSRKQSLPRDHHTSGGRRTATNRDDEVQGKHPTKAGTLSLPLGGLKNTGNPQVLMWELK